MGIIQGKSSYRKETEEIVWQRLQENIRSASSTQSEKRRMLLPVPFDEHILLAPEANTHTRTLKIPKTNAKFCLGKHYSPWQKTMK